MCWCHNIALYLLFVDNLNMFYSSLQKNFSYSSKVTKTSKNNIFPINAHVNLYLLIFLVRCCNLNDSSLVLETAMSQSGPSEFVGKILNIKKGSRKSYVSLHGGRGEVKNRQNTTSLKVEENGQWMGSTAIYFKISPYSHSIRAVHAGLQLQKALNQCKCRSDQLHASIWKILF